MKTSKNHADFQIWHPRISQYTLFLALNLINREDIYTRVDFAISWVSDVMEGSKYSISTHYLRNLLAYSDSDVFFLLTCEYLEKLIEKTPEIENAIFCSLVYEKLTV